MAAERVLVIVESPAKAKTIEGYLNGGGGRDFRVKASVGHVRDLASKASELPESQRKQPWAKYAVNTDEGFTPFYVVHANKKATIAELKKELAGASELLLATDEDREGEAIAWHLLEVLKPKVPVRRMVFHEITEHAISDALEQTRELDMRLVDAQETRRIVDRLGILDLAVVATGSIGNMVVPVELRGLRASRRDRLLRQGRGVGAHVRDVAAFVKPLSHPHGALRIPTESA